MSYAAAKPSTPTPRPKSTLPSKTPNWIAFCRIKVVLKSATRRSRLKKSWRNSMPSTTKAWRHSRRWAFASLIWLTG